MRLNGRQEIFCLLNKAAFHSNEEDFRELFDAFDIDKAYSSFAEHLGGKGDEDTDFFKEFMLHIFLVSLTEIS